MMSGQHASRTKAIYSKQEVSSLYNQFKCRLNQLYNQQSEQSIRNLMQVIELIYYLSDIPFLLKELNQFGQVKILGTLEVLFMKSHYMKQHKDYIQKWVSTLMRKIAQYEQKYQLKSQIQSISFIPQKQMTDIQFFSKYLQQVSKSQAKSQQSIAVAITYLRIFIINEIQNKKRLFMFTNKDDELQRIGSEWRAINQNLIKICGQLDNLKREQICVSISYWLCTQNKQFIKQCVLKGTILLLCQTLGNKNITQRYGKKILNFLKLLMIQLDKTSQYFTPSHIETSVAQFTLLFDNESVLEQSRNIYSYLNNHDGKVHQQIASIQKYSEQKQKQKDKALQQKNIQNLLKNLRVLLMYSENEKIKNELAEASNIQYLAKVLKKEENISLQAQIFNIIAYNLRSSDNDVLVIEKLGALFNSAFKDKDKLNELIGNNKKLLLNFIRLLKHMLHSRKFSEKLMQKIKSDGIIKKLGRMSDCQNLIYQKQLLSLIQTIIEGNRSKKADEKQQLKQSLQIKMNVLKMINDGPKKLRRKLQEQLEQLQLLHELLARGDGKNIKEEIIVSIVKKINTIKNDTESVQITMLDQSDEQKNRQILNRINYKAISSLINIESDSSQIQFNLQKSQVEKLISIGLTTEDRDTLKSLTQYLVLLVSHGKLQNQKQIVAEVFKKCKQKIGQDLELHYEYQETKQKPKCIEQASKKQVQQLLQKGMKERLSIQEVGELQNILLEEDEIRQQQWLQKLKTTQQFSSESSLPIILKFLLKLAHSNKFKQIIYLNYGEFLLSQLDKSSDSNQNLLFKIFTKLFDLNLENSKQFFNNLLKKSYDFLTKDSIQFTNICLNVFQYQKSKARQDHYWKFIYNCPEMIGRQAAFIIKGDKQKSEKFWSFFAKEIQKNVEQQRKLTLQFLQLNISNISKQNWEKFNLSILAQKLLENLNKKNSQIHSKGANENLLRKLIRLARILKEVFKNENTVINQLINRAYQTITKILITHPNMKTSSQDINKLSKEYVEEILQNLKEMYKRREAYNSVKKQIARFEGICKNLSEYKSPQMSDTLIEIYRILFLRNDKHEQYSTIVQMYSHSKQLLLPNLTQRGRESNQACQKAIEAIQKSNQSIFKKLFLDYFFCAVNSISQNQENVVLSDDELLKYLKNLQNPPYQYGINFLQSHLKLIQNSQFSNALVKIFYNSEKLYQQDKENKKLALEEIQNKIIDCIWGPGCQINGDFYKTISLNIAGLKLCLKTKGIGVEGINIVCEKVNHYPEHISLFAQILHINVASNKEWNLVLQKKIPQIVDNAYKQKGKDEKQGKALANFIGSSSKLKGIQNQYKIQNQLFANLQTYAKNVPCLAATLHAISGLVYLNDQNQKILGKKEHTKYYLAIISQNEANPIIFEKGCNLLSNLAYKNTGLVTTYIQQGVQTSIIKIASGLVYDHTTYKQFLRFIGNLSLSLEGANSIVKTKFMFLWQNILKQAQLKKHEDIIKYSFDIVFNLLNFQQIQAKAIASKILQADCLPRIIHSLQKHCLVNSIVQSGLDSLEKLFIIEESRKQALDNNILDCMEDIAKTQSSNEKVLEKWIKLLNSIVKVPEFVENLLKSQIFISLAQFIKQHLEINTEYLNIILSITEFIFQKSEHKLFISSGFVFLLVSLLKIKHLKNINAATIIEYFNILHNEKILTQQSYIDAFGGLMSRLQIQFRDQNSKKIISSIIKFRDHIIIDTHSAAILLQFGSVFMTKSQIVSSRKYQKRVKEFLCLLTYFISFSNELKIIFSNEGFIQILQSWIKIQKSLDEETQVREACRICMFSIMNQQRLLINVSNEFEQNKQMFVEKLLLPVKCLLYRRDHSNKGAILQLRRQENKLELVAYKAPDGQIKQKYTCPLTQLICIRAYQSQQDTIFKDSIFSKTKNVFQKDASAVNCLTLVGIVGEQLSVRQFDVEFPSQAARDEWKQMMKGLISLSAYRRKYI